jgi:thymidylate synthase (FAD)
MDSWAGIDGDDSIKRYCEMLNANALSAYQNLLDAGVAPEQARMVLPQSMMTSYYVTGSLAAFARAYKLRSDTHSQLEIQHLATLWNEIIRPLFPVSWAALVDNEKE